MHVVFDRLAGAFFGRLEQRAHVYVKAEVGKGRSHDLGAAVMAVLAELGDHHARAAAFRLSKRVDFGFQGFPAFGRVISGCIHSGHLLRIGAVAPVNFFERIADLAHRGAQAYRLDRQVQQVA